MATITDSYIPRRLDDQWKLGLWDIDIAAPPAFFFMLGFLSHSKLGMVLCLLIGFGISRWIGRIKSDKHPAFALHWLYWYFPVNPLTKMRMTPSSVHQRMVG